MGRALRVGRVLFEVCRFVDQHVGALRDFNHVSGVAGIAGVDDLRPRRVGPVSVPPSMTLPSSSVTVSPFFSLHRSGPAGMPSARAFSTSNWPAISLSITAKANAGMRCATGVQKTCVRSSSKPGRATPSRLAGIAGRDLGQLHGPAQISREGRRAVERDGSLPSRLQGARGQQARQAENVVAVHVGDEDAIDLAQPQSRSHDLVLGPSPQSNSQAPDCCGSCSASALTLRYRLGAPELVPRKVIFIVKSPRLRRVSSIGIFCRMDGSTEAEEMVRRRAGERRGGEGQTRAKRQTEQAA